MSQPFKTTLKIAFGDVDSAKILYYPKFLHYCHVSFEAFMEEVCGVSYAILLEDRNLGFPMVHLDVDYQHPMRYGESLEMAISVESVGRKSLKLAYRAMGPEGVLRATAVGTTVMVAMDDFQSQLIPDWIRAGLKKYQLSHD